VKKIIAHIKIFRPLNLSIGAFAVIITASILNKLDMVSSWLTALLVVVCYNAAANAINDYFDQETDKINRPNRPLIVGDVKPKTALILSIMLFVIGTILVLTLPLKAMIIAIVIAMPLMIFYSVWFKSVPLVGNFIISFILGLTFIFAGAALQDMEKMFILAMLAVGLTMVRELIKDIADYDGDLKADLKTFPTVFGYIKAWRIAGILSTIVGVGILIPYILEIFNYWYIIIVIIGIEIPLAISAFYAVKTPSLINAIKSARMLKFSTIMGVLAVWLGSIK
jgi:geranylgeranylglycerol-phosphate geranylgeranyltransferase